VKGAELKEMVANADETNMAQERIDLNIILTIVVLFVG
jgi:hypothetical protein